MISCYKYIYFNAINSDALDSNGLVDVITQFLIKSTKYCFWIEELCIITMAKSISSHICWITRIELEMTVYCQLLRVICKSKEPTKCRILSYSCEWILIHYLRFVIRKTCFYHSSETVETRTTYKQWKCCSFLISFQN